MVGSPDLKVQVRMKDFIDGELKGKLKRWWGWSENDLYDREYGGVMLFSVVRSLGHYHGSEWFK